MNKVLKEYWLLILIGVLLICGSVYFVIEDNSGKIAGKKESGNDVVFAIGEENVTADEFYDDEMKYYRENIPLAQDKMQEYSMLVFNSKHRDYLEEKLGKVAFKNIELELKSFNEKMVPYMQEEGKLVQQ